MLNISKNKIDDELAELQLYSLKTLKTPHLGIYLARVLLVLFVVALIALFLPWQQNIRGTGTLTALRPENRPQTIESTLPGRITQWHVQEGQYVDQGDTILSLAELKDKYFDPELLTRTQEQVDAKNAGLMAKELKKEAYKNQVIALKEALKAKMSQAQNKLEQAILKVQSDSINYEAEKTRFANNENIYLRNKIRYDSGNITLSKFQELETKYMESASKRLYAENLYFQSQTSLAIALTDLSAIQAEYSEKISKATSELQATFSDISDSRADISKLKNEYANIQIRQELYQVIAPRAGYVVKALKAGIGETIKEGEAVVTIMPGQADMAVEMYVQAMDIPLISPGKKVRIQFDGWPALQFSGWPNVSVGTFGGIVQVIDRVDSGKGKFRILVKPDPDETAWPEQLRMGSGIKGWVMLNNVPIWYEMWRQLNGFPPSLYLDEDNQAEQKSGIK